jgi:hypothetical protein
LINLEKVLFKAVNRIENRDMVGIGVPIKVATGAMHGGVGALLGLVAGLVDTPAIKAHIAIALHKARGRAATPVEIASILGRIKATAKGAEDGTTGTVIPVAGGQREMEQRAPASQTPSEQPASQVQAPAITPADSRLLDQTVNQIDNSKDYKPTPEEIRAELKRRGY